MNDRKGAFVREWLPSWEAYAQQIGMRLSGRDGMPERRAICGIHGGERDSLTINMRGPWQCKACGAVGGDVLAYHQALHGLRFADAARDLGAWVDGDERERAAKPPPRVVEPRTAPSVSDIDQEWERAAPRQRVERHERLSDFGRELWDACRPLSGEARAYLEVRNCVLPPADGDLRWHPALKHPPSGLICPALVALVTDAITGAPLTLHRTWIRPDGNKASVTPPRMLLAGHRKAGGVVRLWPDDSVTLGLGVGEGIETALSLAHAFTPVWACIDAGNMAELPVLEGIESLLIAADNDAAGISAANICGARWAGLGREARIVVPNGHSLDLNDVARAP